MKSASELDDRWERNYNATQIRHALKSKAFQYLGGACKICGYDKCLAAIDFHHRDPRQKDFAISLKMSWPAIEKELDKCVALCANCHREVHAGLHPQYLDTPRLEDDADEFEMFTAFV